LCGRHVQTAEFCGAFFQAETAAHGVAPYHNSMAAEVIQAFERHGFIWGGRWYHYDTMHFEYRPELLEPPARR